MLIAVLKSDLTATVGDLQNLMESQDASSHLFMSKIYAAFEKKLDIVLIELKSLKA